MRLIEGKPQALPGSCYLCGAASRDQFVDLETQVEFHGAMYLCDKCIIQMGDAVGMLSVKKRVELEKTLVKLKQDNEVLEEERQSLKRVLRGYDDVRAFISDDLVPAWSDGAPKQDLSRREKELEGGEGGPSESFDVKRLDDLRSIEGS